MPLSWDIVYPACLPRRRMPVCKHVLFWSWKRSLIIFIVLWFSYVAMADDLLHCSGILQVSFGDMIACDNENVSNRFTFFVAEDIDTHHLVTITAIFFSVKEENGFIISVLV
jgi:hypothetical protein